MNRPRISRLWEGDCGQASAEYAAVALLVSVVLAGGAALTSGGLGDSVSVAIRRGVCEVTGQACPKDLSAVGARDLEACPLRRTSAQQGFSLDVGFVRLAGELGLVVEALSDGKVRVSFADTGAVGGGVAAGAHVQFGGVGANAEASVDATFAVTAGRAWTFANAAAAKRFVASYGAGQTLNGRLAQRVRSLCPVCAMLVDSPQMPPKPDEQWVAGGLGTHGNVGVGGGTLKAAVDVVLKGALGRRVSRQGTVWYVRLDDRLSGELDALGFGIDGQGGAVGLASLNVGDDGIPTSIRITVEHRTSTRKGLHVPKVLGGVIGRGAVGSGEVVESESLLSLASPADRTLALKLIAALGGADPSGARRAAAGLQDAISTRGIRTIRRFSLTRQGTRVGAGAGAGVRLGLDVALDDFDQRLTAVASKLPGIDWLPRADCLAV